MKKRRKKILFSQKRQASVQRACNIEQRVPSNSLALSRRSSFSSIFTMSRILYSCTYYLLITALLSLCRFVFFDFLCHNTSHAYLRIRTLISDWRRWNAFAYEAVNATTILAAFTLTPIVRGSEARKYTSRPRRLTAVRTISVHVPLRTWLCLTRALAYSPRLYHSSR